jgi:poly(hydroxyalkanoate) depolymerase family esterase
MRVPSSLVAVALLVAGCGAVARPTAAPIAGAGFQAHAKGAFTSGTFDGRGYKLYTPGGVTGARPLVVMLHGCTQGPDDFAKGTKMNALAEKEGFAVLYPAQTRNDHPMACMPWYEPAHWQRGQGLAGQIVGMIDQVGKDQPLDKKAIYVAGLSAGAAYASALAVAYPDVFAAVGVHSGLEYGAATSQMAAQMAMFMGGPDPDTAGRKAYEAMGDRKRVVPAIVVHGTADYTVAAKNADQVARQWAQTADLATNGKDDDDVDGTPDARKTEQAPGGRSYTRYTFTDKAGRAVVEQVMVDGMGHAWAGGDSAGSYTDPKGPDASRMMWDFFEAHKLGPVAKKKAK